MLNCFYSQFIRIVTGIKNYLDINGLIAGLVAIDDFVVSLNKKSVVSFRIFDASYKTPDSGNIFKLFGFYQKFSTIRRAADCEFCDRKS